MGKKQSKKKAGRPAPPTAAELVAESDFTGGGGGGSDVGGAGFMAFEPEPGDEPVGHLTDAQLGSRIRMICARGFACFLYRFEAQIYLRVVRPD